MDGVRLAETVRPRHFEGVIGQETAVAILRRNASTEHGTSFLLTGPPGCGKTTLAEIYAYALLCQNAAPPCGQTDCPDCASFLEGYEHLNLKLMEGGVEAEAEAARLIAAHAATETLSGGQLVVLIERVDRLSGRTLDQLRTRLERSPAAVTFILCTDRPDDLPDKLRTLFVELPLVHPGMGGRIAYLKRLAAAIGVVISPAISSLVAEYGGPSLEHLARDVATLHETDALTVEGASAYYGLTLTAPVLHYLEVLLADQGLPAQVAALESWQASPAQKIGDVQRVLGDLFRGEVLRLPGSNAGRLTSEDACARVVAALTARGSSLGYAPRAFWEALLALWQPETDATAATLLARASAFDTFVSLTLSARRSWSNEQEARARGRPRTRLRPGRPSRGVGSRERGPPHLTFAQAQGLWDAAAFMVQMHGVHFNTRITLRYRALGLTDPNATGPLMTALTHELRQNLQRRARAAGVPFLFCWAYVHEYAAGCALRTHLAAHVPPELGAIGNWVRGRFLPRHLARHADCAPSPVEPSALRVIQKSTRTDLRMHLALLRLLSRGLDPTLSGGVAAGRALLVQLVGIPDRLRRPPIGRVAGGQRCGVSREIDQESRALEGRLGLPFVSAWEERDWGATARDHDLTEHLLRMDKKSALNVAFRGWDTEPVWADRREAELVRERGNWEAAVRLRLKRTK